MELKLLEIPGIASAGVVQVADAIFAEEYNPSLIHQVVESYLAGARAGTRAQKSRSEVSGGGAKPWRQKGTGRARAGTNRSPIWRGGGVTFAAKSRDFSKKVNKKMYCGAICSILSELVRQDRLIVVEKFAVPSPKTGDLLKQLKELNSARVLIVTESVEPNLYLAARNLQSVGVCDANGVDPVDLIGFDKIIFTVPALKAIEEKLA